MQHLWGPADLECTAHVACVPRLRRPDITPQRALETTTSAPGSHRETRRLASQQPDSHFETVPQLLARNVHQYGDQPAYRFKELGIWQSWNWTESAAEIDGLALGLVDLGLEEGDHVAIIGRNHPVL